MGFLRVARFSLWGAAILFSTITFALATHLIWFDTTNSGFSDIATITGAITTTYPPYAAMAVATGALTLLTLPVFIGIDETRNGAITSMIATEMGVLTILWVLWLTTAALTVGAATAASVGCTSLANQAQYLGLSGGDPSAVCHEIPAIEAFSFLSFFALLGYAFVLLVFTLIAHNRGHSEIWTQSVKYANFFAPPVNAPPGVNEKAGGVPQMVPQYQYPPNFSPPPQQFMPQGMPYGVVQQPMYPSYTGSPVPQQHTPLPGQFMMQPGYGQV